MQKSMGCHFFYLQNWFTGWRRSWSATPIDFFYSRTGALLFHIDLVRQWREQVISYMEEKFNWTVQEKKENQSFITGWGYKCYPLHPRSEE